MATAAPSAACVKAGRLLCAGYSYLSGDLLQSYTFDRWTLRLHGDALELARLLQVPSCMLYVS